MSSGRALDCRGRSRGGWTLVEALVVISLATIVLSSGTSLLLAVRGTKATVQAAHHNSRTARQLGDAFRRDMSGAVSYDLREVDSAFELVINSRDDQTVTYLQQLSDVQRTVREGEAVVARDVYRFATETRVSWQAAEATLGPARGLTMAMAFAAARGRSETSTIMQATGWLLSTVNGGEDE